MLFIYNGSKREQITVLWCNLASNKSHYAGKTVKCKMDLMLHLNPPLLMNGLWINSPHLHFRTLKSPKTGTRQCSNRYTEYPVRGKTSTFDVFLCWLSRPVCVCVFLSVFVCCMLCMLYVMSRCALSLHHCAQSLLRKTLTAPPTFSPTTLTFRWDPKVSDGSVSALVGFTDLQPPLVPLQILCCVSPFSWYFPTSVLVH